MPLRGCGLRDLNQPKSGPSRPPRVGVAGHDRDHLRVTSQPSKPGLPFTAVLKIGLMLTRRTFLQLMSASGVALTGSHDLTFLSTDGNFYQNYRGRRPRLATRA
jgi:hypothetical protein